MWKYPLSENVSEELVQKFHKYTKITGVVFVILGLIGILFPEVMTLATVSFVSWLLLFAGIFSGYFTYLSDKEDFIGWLKSLALIGVSLFMIFYPLNSIGTVGLLLSIYFFMDAFASFSMAMNMRPHKGWIMWLLNSIFSILLGALFVIGWPMTSIYLIGLFVGFSLFFDGVSLLTVGSIFKKMHK